MKSILEKKSGIYAIQNKIDGKIYVGSAINIKYRRYSHLRSLNNGNHHSVKLQRAWTKYGEDAFVFFVLELVESKDMLIQKEQMWIDRFDAYGPNGYNMVPNAGTNLGMICSLATKAKIGAKARGRIVSNETKAKMSASAPKTRPKLSEEHKKKIAMTLMGLSPNAETRAKMAAARIGRKVSTETRAKMSASMKGKNTGKHSAEHCAKISEALKGNHYALGYKHSAETRAKVSAAGLGRVFSIERNSKMAAKLRGRKQTPEHIENHAAAIRGRKITEEVRSRISASLLNFYASRREVLGREAKNCAL